MQDFKIKFDRMSDKLLKHGWILIEDGFGMVASEKNGDLKYEFYTLKEVNSFILGLSYRKNNT